MTSLPEAGMSLPDCFIRKEEGTGSTRLWSGLVGGACETMATNAGKDCAGDRHYSCPLQHFPELLPPAQGEERRGADTVHNIVTVETLYSRNIVQYTLTSQNMQSNYTTNTHAHVHVGTRLCTCKALSGYRKTHG